MKKKDKKTIDKVFPLKPSKKKAAKSPKNVIVDSAASGSPATDKSRPPTVNYKDFVKAWVKASSVAEVAETFGIKTTSASAIANRLRKAKIILKRFPRRGAQAIDVRELNRIAAGKE